MPSLLPTTALVTERNDSDLMRQRFDANMLLITTTSGVWDISVLPEL